MINRLIGLAGMLAMTALTVTNIMTVGDKVVTFLCVVAFVCFAISFIGDGWDGGDTLYI